MLIYCLSNYLDMKQNLELVYYLWFHTVISFMIYVGLLGKNYRNKYSCSHRVALKGGTLKQNYFHHHFLRLLEDCKITFTDKTNFSDLTKMEFYDV